MANVGNINVKIGADVSGLSSGIKAAQSSLSGFAEMARNATSVSLGMLGIQAFQSLNSTITESISLYSRFTAAQIGLKSIVTSQGRDFEQANSFIQSYISDGLVPLGEAVTSYKQLAQRGYSSDQIEAVMLRLKDSAAFARQGQLTMGQAIRGATEGLKNELSMLVDNAGVTKNVSQMWGDYADSIGVGVGSLTKAQKIQAEVNGIIQETSFQLGDAARYSSTLGGQTALLSTQLSYLKAALGGVLAPLIQAIIPSLVVFIKTVITALNSLAMFTKALFGTNVAQTKVAEAASEAAGAQLKVGDATKKASDKVKKSIASFDEINQLQESIAKNADDISNNTAGVSGTNLTAEAPQVDTADNAAISQSIVDFSNKVKTALEPIGNYFKEIGTIFSTFWTNIQPTLEIIGNVLLSVFTPAWAATKIIISEVGEIIKDLLSGGLKTLQGILELIAGIISGDWNLAWKGTKNILVGVYESITAIPNAIKDLGEKAFKTFTEFVAHNKTLQDHKELILGIATAITTFFLPALISTGIQATIAGIKIIGSFVASLITTGVQAAATGIIITGQLISAIISYAIQGWKAVISIGAQTAAWIINSVTVIAATAATIAHSVATATLTAAQWLLNAAMAANPFVLIAVLIAAVTGAIILLYKNSETFRNIVTVGWELIKKVADVVFTSLAWWFNEIYTWVTTKLIPTFLDMKNGIVNAFNTISGVVTGVWEGIKNGVKGGINTTLGYINGFIRKINSISISIPAVDVPGVGKIGGGTIGFPKIPEIPYLAGGGVTTGATLAMIGDNPSGREAVIPLDNSSVMDSLGSTIATAVVNAMQFSGSGQSSMSQTLQAILNIDGSTIARALIPVLDREEGRRGNNAIVQMA